MTTRGPRIPHVPMLRRPGEAGASKHGTPPKTGWARMVPELLVADFATSLAFWRDVLHFTVAYQRPDEFFAYLERPEGAQLMLSHRHGDWETGPLHHPFGRGVMFQISVDGLDAVIDSLSKHHWPLYHPQRTVWRRTGDRETGQREIFVQDPDGYLIMIAETIGERSISVANSSHDDGQAD